MTDLEIYAHISISRASALANRAIIDTDKSNIYFDGYFDACKDIMDWIEHKMNKELEAMENVKTILERGKIK